MNSRSEPLLWLQLLSLGALPLEALLLFLLLAGSDPGPLPWLERILCWALGALAPTLLLWRRPGDVWSLLVVQIPPRGRRDLQNRLSALQDQLPLRLGLAFGTAVALPLLWWLDRHAAVAGSFSPISGSPRLVALLLTAGLLTVMLWQWQQLLQALWLILRPADQVAATPPMGQQDLESDRLSLGLPLLLPPPLCWTAPAPSASAAVPVEPQQGTEEANRSDLNQQVD